MTTQSQGLHTHVLDTLGLEISSGRFPPGSVLRTDELAQRFDVSRTVVREVVRVLESMHLVESRRRVGVTVRPTETWNVYDPQVIRWRLAGADRPRQLRSLTVLRSAIEPVAGGRARPPPPPPHCPAGPRHRPRLVGPTPRAATVGGP
ncbi:GntR family transcriptional regulator, partial [Streptomyces anulatus]